MPLLLPLNYEGLDPKLRSVIEDLTARVQAWAGQVDGVNAAERLNQLTEGVSNLPTVRTGMVQAFAGPSTAIPAGYLLCDGAAVSRTTYANLFAVLGATWGAGNGTTTFNLPDGRGRSFYGKATSGTGSTLGGTFGAIDHTHTGPSHTHTVSGSTADESAHTHDEGSLGATAHTGFYTVSADANGGGATVSVSASGHTHPVTGDTGTGTAHSHGAGTLAAAAGGTGATGTANPPGFVGNWIIKT
jgi:microcystin-dependent protein